MRKISLDVDDLRVESFETVGDDGETRGTVQAYYSRPTECPQTQCGAECPSGWSDCEASIAWTDGYAVCRCYTHVCVEL